jgi:hypothetical protein
MRFPRRLLAPVLTRRSRLKTLLLLVNERLCYCSTFMSYFLLQGTLIVMKGYELFDIAFIHIHFSQRQCIITDTYDFLTFIWPHDRKVEHKVQ